MLCSLSLCQTCSCSLSLSLSLSLRPAFLSLFVPRARARIVLRISFRIASQFRLFHKASSCLHGSLRVSKATAELGKRRSLCIRKGYITQILPVTRLAAHPSKSRCATPPLELGGDMLNRAFKLKRVRAHPRTEEENIWRRIARTKLAT